MDDEGCTVIFGIIFFIALMFGGCKAIVKINASVEADNNRRIKMEYDERRNNARLKRASREKKKEDSPVWENKGEFKTRTLP